MSIKDFFKKLTKAPKAKVEMDMTRDAKSSPLFEIYVEAWKRYHIAANMIDGGIEHPTTSRQREFMYQGQVAGKKAMFEFLYDRNESIPSDDKEKLEVWDAAKLESVRRYGK